MWAQHQVQLQTLWNNISNSLLGEIPIFLVPAPSPKRAVGQGAGYQKVLEMMKKFFDKNTSLFQQNYEKSTSILKNRRQSSKS